MVFVKGYKPTKEHRKNISKALTGQKLSDKTKAKIGLANRGNKNRIGQKNSKEHNKKVSDALKKFYSSTEERQKLRERVMGDKSPLWKGGITPKNAQIRNSREYKHWRTGVFERDGYLCRKTGNGGSSLCVHHIYNFYKYKELRFCVANGITLSRDSHQEFHRTYGNIDNNQEQLIKFLGH